LKETPLATEFKIISAKEVLEVTTDGNIDIAACRQLLVDIAKADHHQTDYELLVDFRGTESQLSIIEIYQLAAELHLHGSTFHRKVALVVTPGVHFERASFFETCSHNRGFSVNAYTEYEAAVRWILKA
jgi:hypothetical protein